MREIVPMVLILIGFAMIGSYYTLSVHQSAPEMKFYTPYLRPSLEVPENRIVVAEDAHVRSDTTSQMQFYTDFDDLDGFTALTHRASAPAVENGFCKFYAFIRVDDDASLSGIRSLNKFDRSTMVTVKLRVTEIDPTSRVRDFAFGLSASGTVNAIDATAPGWKWVGFVLDRDVLYAFSLGTVDYRHSKLTAISDVDVTQWHTYTIDRYYSTARFYVDGTLVATHGYNDGLNWYDDAYVVLGVSHTNSDGSDDGIGMRMEADWLRVQGGIGGEGMSFSDVNYGSHQTLYIGRNEGVYDEPSANTPYQEHITFLKFDISEIDRTNPNLRVELGVGAWNTASAAYKNSFGLSRVGGHYEAIPKIVVGIYRVDNDNWSENEITWNSMPSIENRIGLLSENEIRRVVDNQPFLVEYRVDITDAVLAETDNTLSLALKFEPEFGYGYTRCDIPQNSEMLLASKELTLPYKRLRAGATYPPSLWVSEAPQYAVLHPSGEFYTTDGVVPLEHTERLGVSDEMETYLTFSLENVDFEVTGARLWLYQYFGGTNCYDMSGSAIPFRMNVLAEDNVVGTGDVYGSGAWSIDVSDADFSDNTITLALRPTNDWWMGDKWMYFCSTQRGYGWYHEIYETFERTQYQWEEFPNPYFYGDESPRWMPWLTMQGDATYPTLILYGKVPTEEAPVENPEQPTEETPWMLYGGISFIAVGLVSIPFTLKKPMRRFR